MANPRKFSEKIALHTQKQAEETLAFEQIMREVSDATSKENLLASALSNMEELSPSNRENQMYIQRDRGRSPGVGPIRSRPAEKRLDTSPYSSGAYLSPPPENSWRRTNSDSALHQSALTLSPDNSLHSPGSQRRGRMHADHHQGQHHMVMGDGSDRKHLMVTQDGRPRSYCDPRVPGINIFPSQHEPGTIQIPIGNNTGSLPDLTSFHFPSPLPTPLDQEELSTSPYSASSQNASPSTLSPTSQSSRPMGRFPFGSPHHQAESPGHSPGSRRRPYPQQHLQNLVIGPHSPTNPQNQLSVPVNPRYLHTCKGVTLDNSGQAVQLDTFQQSQYTGNIYNQTVQTSNSQNIPTHHMNSLGSYRNPQSENRPSPMNSPGLTVQGGLYRSNSPGLTNHSGPQSPVSPASSPGIGSANNPFSDNTNYYISQAQANALQQHFEQFSMLDNPVSTSTSMNYIGSQSNSLHYSQAVSGDDCLSLVGSQELHTDPGYYSQSPSSQMHFTQQSGINPSGGSTQQTTPQTPTSIPDIILTDFSSGGDMSRQEFVKDLGCAMSGSFDSEFVPSDELLREGLDPIDFDGLQMLTDPDMNVITDPSTEDTFRLDRL